MSLVFQMHRIGSFVILETSSECERAGHRFEVTDVALAGRIPAPSGSRCAERWAADAPHSPDIQLPFRG
ncbi:hypothetical protein ANANG_G00220270 [Anguilla anguilla]|uniref:Uncharacterized protein n=1 Tax=Anguilla anguilla TaxID=7936 RepID=A0A9D3RQ05_ANGAN|nr:hypothetical protein ANANG_G00220270 [Anguilla anguilla]